MGMTALRRVFQPQQVIAELEQLKEERARDKINFETEKCELESKIDKYKGRCAELQNENENVQSENEKLQSENKRLRKYLQDLESANINVGEKSQINLYNTDLNSQITKAKESNYEALNINSLPEEILVKVFGYLYKNELGQIARVCRRWSILTKRRILWKNVNMQFTPSHESQTTVAEYFVNLLPPFVTYLRLNFIDRSVWSERFNFDEISVKLEEKCPDLKVLILEEVVLTDSLPSVIHFCTLYLHKVQILEFHFCEFPACLAKDQCDYISKIEVLELKFCELRQVYWNRYSNKLSFSKLPNLKQLRLNGTCQIDSWFHDDPYFINQLLVLDLGYVYVSFRTYQAIQNHGLILSELYLCGTYLDDIDLYLNNSVFPHLKTICLGSCCGMTCEGVISLIQSCPSLLNVFVDEHVAESYVAHPFVVASGYKTGIVKSIHINHTHNYLLKQ